MWGHVRFSSAGGELHVFCGEICSSRRSLGHCSRPDASVVSRNDVASLTFSGLFIDEILLLSVHLKNCCARGARHDVVFKSWNDDALQF